jgi:hypothetical protein
MRIAVAQINCTVGNIRGNAASVICNGAVVHTYHKRILSHPFSFKESLNKSQKLR